jgi:ABC-type dipeptide/oligopeptide/nickel transport system permease subunit
MTESMMAERLASVDTKSREDGGVVNGRHSLPPIAWIGAIILLFYLFVALFAPQLAPYDPTSLDAKPLLKPSAEHLLGTNDIGQDILSELIYGTRASLLVASVTSLLVLGLATAVGTLSGYMGGLVDTIFMRVVDIMLAIPRLPLMILLAAYVGSGLPQIILIIALFSWPISARLIRSEVLSLRHRPHIQASRTFGGGTLYVLFRHLIPALTPILVTNLATQASRAVMMEAGLAFLGLGDPTIKSWGLIIRFALSFSSIYFGPHWIWWILPAGFNITLLMLGFTFLGQGLEVWVNPRTKRY